MKLSHLASCAAALVLLLMGLSCTSSGNCPSAQTEVCDESGNHCVCSSTCNATSDCDNSGAARSYCVVSINQCMPPSMMSTPCPSVVGQLCQAAGCVRDPVSGLSACAPFCLHSSECATGCCTNNDPPVCTLTSAGPGSQFPAGSCRP